jgi:hypothetical protein
MIVVLRRTFLERGGRIRGSRTEWRISSAGKGLFQNFGKRDSESPYPDPHLLKRVYFFKDVGKDVRYRRG